MTTDFRPEPCARLVAAATSLVWNAISHSRSSPSTCSIHRSAGFMVWKFDVRWSMRWKPKRLPRSEVGRAGAGTNPGYSVW
jgi:hypothetical protein